MTVAPPTLVESTKTFPPRSSLMKAVVAMEGSSASARAAIALVAAAASSGGAWSSTGHEHVHALGAARLHRALQTDIGQGLAHQVGRPDSHREGVGVGRVEIEHEMGHTVGTGRQHEGRVVLHGALVGEPDQRAAVVAQRVRHVPLRRLGPELHRGHPRRRVLRDVLLHEGVPATVDADDRQRPVLQRGDDPLAHAVEVVDEVPLGGAGTVEQRLVEVGQGHAGPGCVAAPSTHGADATDLSVASVPAPRPLLEQ